MNKRKICVVLTARTSYAKIKPILAAIKANPDLMLQLICGASSILEQYGHADKIVEADGFQINERIYMLLEGETLLTSAKALGLGIIEFAGAFDRLKPDVVLVMADRFEIMAPALAASYQNIPLAHVQGGEVSGNIDEKVRHAVTKMADLHFPATEKAQDRIIKMGENSEKVFFVGCPSIDIAKNVIKKPDIDFDIYDRYGGVGSFPDLSQGYYIVMQHAVTTEYHKAREQITETLYAMEAVNKPVLWFWPNGDAGTQDVVKGIRTFRENKNPKNLHFIKNMSPDDFLRVLYNSSGIIGNSSVAIRESSFLGVPAVNIGTRQEGRERGINVIDVDYDRVAIANAVQNHCGNKKTSSYAYGAGDAGKKIADILTTAPLSSSKLLAY